MTSTTPAVSIIDALIAFLNKPAPPLDDEIFAFANQCVACYDRPPHRSLAAFLESKCAVQAENKRARGVITYYTEVGPVVLKFKYRVNNITTILIRLTARREFHIKNDVAVLKLRLDTALWKMLECQRRIGTPSSPLSRAMFDAYTFAESIDYRQFADSTREETWNGQRLRYDAQRACFVFNGHAVPARHVPPGDALYALLHCETPLDVNVVTLLQALIDADAPYKTLDDMLKIVVKKRDATAWMRIGEKSDYAARCRYNPNSDALPVELVVATLPVTNENTWVFKAEMTADLKTMLPYDSAAIVSNCRRWHPFKACPCKAMYDNMHCSMALRDELNVIADAPIAAAPAPVPGVVPNAPEPQQADAAVPEKAAQPRVTVVYANNKLLTAYPLDQVDKPLPIEFISPSDTHRSALFFPRGRAVRPHRFDADANAELCNTRVFGNDVQMRIVPFKDVCIALAARYNDTVDNRCQWFHGDYRQDFVHNNTCGDVHAYLAARYSCASDSVREPASVWIIEDPSSMVD